MKDAAIGFGIAILFCVGLYFFWHVPEVEKSYKKGLADCSSQIDTVFTPGKDSIIYRDTSYASVTPVIVEDKDSIISLSTGNEKTFISGKDTITTRDSVKIDVNKKEGIWDIKNLKANWTGEIEHKDYYKEPDTIKISVPKYFETITTETNWLISGITFILGIVSAITIFFLAQ